MNTAELTARVARKYRKMTDALGVPQRAVFTEVSVDSIETWAERHDRRRYPFRPDPHLTQLVLDGRIPLAPDHIDRHEGYMAQIRSKPGWRRRIDVVAVGLWSKVAGEIDGFEVKVSRSDLLTELRDPRKAGTGARFCNRWWLAAADPSIFAGLDLPPEWGILVPRGRGLSIYRQATELDPEPLSGQFLASLLCCAITQAVPNNPAPGSILQALIDRVDPTDLAHLAAKRDFPTPALDPARRSWDAGR